MLKDCSKKIALKLSGSMTVIGESAFSGCTELTSITIPEGITKIDSSAFYGCTGLTEVKLPASINEIEENPFSNCVNLTRLTVNDGNSKYKSESNVVYDNTEKKALFAAKGVTGSITIPNGITAINGGAFSGCAKLENVTIPESVTAIYNHAFFDCKSLVSITIPKSVMYINKNAFGGCTNAEIVLSEDISNAIYIEGAAFGTYDKWGPCKKVKIKSGADYEAIKNKVIASNYPEDRIEPY